MDKLRDTIHFHEAMDVNFLAEALLCNLKLLVTIDATTPPRFDKKSKNYVSVHTFVVWSWPYFKSKAKHSDQPYLF